MRLAEGLDMVGGQDHNLAKLLPEEDCCSHRGDLRPGWIYKIKNILLMWFASGKIWWINKPQPCLWCVLQLRRFWRNSEEFQNYCKWNVAMLLLCNHKMPPFRNMYRPEALCFRWKVVRWQQVCRGNTGILMVTVTLLRPQHPLHFLKQKHTSCHHAENKQFRQK